MDRMANVDWDKSSQEGILSLIYGKGTKYDKVTALYHCENHEWKNWSYGQITAKVKQVSDYLIEQGIEEDDRIAILSESRPEWVVAFLVSVRCAAVVVPLDVKLTQIELAAILDDAQPTLIFASAAYFDMAMALQKQTPSLRNVILLNSDPSRPDVRSIDSLHAVTNHEVRDRASTETALIVYTSGTTGKPKGVMITFRNLLYQCNCFEQIVKANSKDLFLSILPLNHLFEFSIGLLGVLYSGARICYANTLYPHELVEIMREKKVTRMITVPLFLKMLKSSIEKQIRSAGPRRERIFRALFRVARRIPQKSVRRLLFRAVHQKFGGKLHEFTCGGAQLDVEVAEFFETLGITVLQGYGLTETSPVVAVNTPEHNRLGSVGRPLPGTELRITAEREILVRGPSVMRGYYKHPDLTREVVDEEGFFHTGDIGMVDADGFLRITGRIKNIIVLGSGKKVSPEEVESVLAETPLFKEVCVVGRISQERLSEGTESVCAVVVPSDSLTDGCGKNADLIAEHVQNEVQRLGEQLAPYKRPSKTVVRFEDLPKTSTRKVKRALVIEWLRQADVSNSVQQTDTLARGASV
jgi:long-chain acyl-CoA synthetase